jgi:hypothetical protein
MDADWRDDEHSIAALATHFKITVRQLKNSTPERLELERLWRLQNYNAETQRWRRRAWYYRRLLICLGELYVTGFTRAPTPGETRPVRWTPTAHHVLADAVDGITRRKKCTDKAALGLMLKAGYFRDPSMTLANAQKRLQKARRCEELLQFAVVMRKAQKKK